MRIKKSNRAKREEKKKMEEEKKAKRQQWLPKLIGVIVAVSIVLAVHYYSCFPYTITSSAAWVTFIAAITAGMAMECLFNMGEISSKDVKTRAKLVGGAYCLCLCLLFISTPIFRSGTYADRITVQEGVFDNDIPKVSDLKKIPLMDTNTAAMIGNRAIGDLTEVVSQFQPSGYQTIIYQNKVIKIAPLLYNSFFKWDANQKNGIPGYVIVDPEDGSSKYVKLENPMKYSPSAYFSQNLTRHARKLFPSKHFANMSFQLDDDGNPVWTILTTTPQTFFTAMKPDGLIIIDAVSGEGNWYPMEEIPEWVDIALNGYNVTDLYNAYGMYKNGFFNAMFSQVGCTKTTNDYGYIAVGNDICIYTGVTSAASDASNLGFLIVNSRTGNYMYYPSSGADESSAMGAAEGALQNYGYTASFPALINISGDPAYAMALKDDSGLIKAYAFVNEKKYTIIGTGETLTEAMNNYRTNMSKNGYDMQELEPAENMEEQEAIIQEIHYVSLKNETYTYLKTEDGHVYKELFAETHLLLNEGEQVKLRYKKEDTNLQIIPCTILWED